MDAGWWFNENNSEDEETIIEDEKTDHFFYGYLYLAIADVITVRQASEVSGVMFIDKEDVLKQAKNCNYASVVAFKEILKRAKAKGII